MFNKRTLIFVCLFFSNKVIAQNLNLVYNPSFEIRNGCPAGYSELEVADGWFQPPPHNGTPDFFHECSWGYVDVPFNDQGYQEPRTGSGYAGLLAEVINPLGPFRSGTYREYIAMKLEEPLVVGTKYFVSFWVNLADSASCSTDQFGMALYTYHPTWYFTGEYTVGIGPTIINTPGQFLDDKVKWMRIAGSFVADYEYQHIYIGNFSDTSNTPLQPTGYRPYVHQWNTDVYYYVDDVCISTDSLFAYDNVASDQEINDQSVQLYPNPVKDILHIESDLAMVNMTIVNSVGQLVMTKQNIAANSSIDLSNLPSGYFMVLISNNETIIRKTILKE